MTTTTLRPVPNRSWRQFAVAVLSAILFSYVVYIARWWLFFHWLGHLPGLGRFSSWKNLLLWGTLEAFVEELIFRGLILRYLARVHWLLGLLVSSAAFAAAHSSPRGISYAYLVQAFLVGLWLGALYLRSRSILVTAVAHCTFNITAKLCTQFLFKVVAS